MHYAVPRILHESGNLDCLITDAYRDPRANLLRFIPPSIVPAAARRFWDRHCPQLPRDKIVALQLFGVAYALRLRIAQSPSSAAKAYLWAGKEFNRRINARGLRGANAIYAFNTAALELFKNSNRNEVLKVLEQTIAPAHVEARELDTEAKAYPAWGSYHRMPKLTNAIAEREKQEWELADIIICGSEYVKGAIAECGGPSRKCAVVPYGVERSIGTDDPVRNRPHDPIRVLTVGAVGLRKGSPRILEAASALKGQAEFRIVGTIPGDISASLLSRGVQFEGTVPRSEVATHYRWADVFLLPTVCEGSATSCYEALSHGLPVITTKNAGSVVRHLREGLVIAAHSSSDIQESILLLQRDYPLYKRLSDNARIRSKAFDLDKYALELRSILL